MILPLTRANQEEWARLCALLWPGSTAEDHLDDLLEGNAQYEYLYYLGDEAVGFISLSIRNDYVEGTKSSPVGYIEGIYVRPECRGRGIARELVEFAKAWTRGRGLTELASDCDLLNDESRAFHKSVGFLEATTVVCFTMDL